MARQAKRTRPSNVTPHYVLDRKTGKEILVNNDNYKDYRSAVDFIRLNKPVEAPTKSPIEPPPAKAPPAKKAAVKKKAARKKAPAKKAPAKKAAK